MTPDDLFGVAGPMAMAGWAVLILGPRGWAWLDAIPRLAVPAALSALYAVLVLTRFAGVDGGFGSLAEVRTLFADDWVLLAGWVHYLAFDLIVGGLLATRMDRAGVHRLVQAPVLVSTFLLGPVGVVLALLIEGALAPLRALSREAAA